MARQFIPYTPPPQQEEPNPVRELSQGVQGALATYMQLKAQQDQTEAAKMQRNIELAKARAEYGEDFTNFLGQVGGGVGPGRMGVTPSPMAQPAATAPAAAAPGLGVPPGAAAPAEAAAAAPSGPRSIMDITPERLAEIKKKSGTKGLKQFQETEDFMLKQQQGKAQLGQIGIQNENALRDDYAKTSSQFKTVADSMATIRSIYSGEVDPATLGKFANAKTPTAARDMALVFAFMRTLDPGSSVRETEYANAQNAAGIPDRIRNVWNRLQTGQILNESQRADFIGTSGDIYAGWLEKQKRVENQYRGIAERQGLNVENVVIPYGIPNYDPAQFRLKGGRGAPPSTPGQPPAAPSTVATTQSQISAAEQWLIANPNNPKAAAVRERVAKLRGS